MELALLLGTAVTLGVLHSVEPDHIAAVSAFVVRRPGRRAAAGYGIRWAAGHGGAVVVAGTVLLLLRVRLGGEAGAWLERGVGLSLLLLGAWVLATARTLHAHHHVHGDGTAHTHLHAHPAAWGHARDDGAWGDAGGDRAAHAHPEAHRHRHAATAIGALHGLAGTAPVVALVPLASVDTPAVGVAYLVAFGLGTAAAMVLYAMFAGLIAAGAARRSVRLGRGLARAAGLGTVAVGVAWLLR